MFQYVKAVAVAAWQRMAGGLQTSGPRVLHDGYMWVAGTGRHDDYIRVIVVEWDRDLAERIGFSFSATAIAENIGSLIPAAVIERRRFPIEVIEFRPRDKHGRLDWSHLTVRSFETLNDAVSYLSARDAAPVGFAKNLLASASRQLA